ncbi:MAG: glycerophosphodiester phosphodiesterase family protein [Prevotellaceae bacterium]|jgi:glycerophosphoryl diester phosphodiesterase|nr:glycerophosphodiester phosphodiesterase family protein [Prevotellaceae bacterium]
MKRNYLILLLLFFCHTASWAQTPKVQVAAHRGDWRNYADNALEGIESCIKMGVDIVEVDVAKTKDGHLILMHDKTLDRTTNGKGKVSDFTLEEIKTLRLRNGLRILTDFQIPTLEETMLTAKRGIIINVDKGDDYFDEVYRVLKKTGTTALCIIKSEKPYAQLYQRYGAILDSMTFMPVVKLKKGDTVDSVRAVFDKRYPFYEISFAEENPAIFSYIKTQFQNTSTVIWLNSLWDSLSAGYTDDRALTNPDGIWGYLIDTLGARIIQTDRPALLLDYLRKRQLHE